MQLPAATEQTRGTAVEDGCEAVEDMNGTEHNFKLLKQELLSHFKGCNLYIKDLDGAIGDEQLHREFSPYGSITSAKVMLVDGCFTGVGFVCFSSPEEATKAVMEMNGRVVGTKPIYVALAQHKEERKAYLKAYHAYWSAPSPAPSDVMPKKDQGRDMELDKRIEALRRKNDALMKRYQEVEADKKRAQDDGLSLQSRKGKVDDLTVTISKSTSDTRVVTAKSGTGGSQEAGPDGLAEDSMGLGRGRRQQLLVTMVRKKGKRVVSEKSERRHGPPDAKSPLEEDSPSQRPAETAGKGKPTSHTAKRELAAAQENQEENTDLTVPTTKEEQEEYLQWKKEREQIDRERVARHKNAKGQWRRAWDMDKTENM